MIARIMAWFGYVKDTPRVWDTERTTTRDQDALVRARRWIAFYQEDGGIGDMIASLRRSYFEKVGTLKPGDHEALAALAMADRIARELDAQVKAIIDAGKIAEAYKEHADKIAALPAAQRRRL